MTERPLILVTNDDGVLSPGLQAAAEAVADLGELLIAAPATQQTAMSRAFVRDAQAGTIERVELTVAGQTMTAHAVSGSPALTVTHALLELAERPVSLCISGINYGENIGAALARSGTVGAAMEADVHGTPGIAASITTPVDEWRTFGTADWTAAMHFTRLLARQVLDEGRPDGVSVLNLNVPQAATPQTELRKTVQSSQRYYVSSRPVPARRLDQPYQLMVDIAVDWDNLEPDSDIHAIARDQVASVTPLTWRMTADTTWTPRDQLLQLARLVRRLEPSWAVGPGQQQRDLPLVERGPLRWHAHVAHHDHPGPVPGTTRVPWSSAPPTCPPRRPAPRPPRGPGTSGHRQPCR